MYTFSQSNSLLLEAEQHWETYGVGGTCIPGAHNLFVADVDSDGVMEIITGGFMYNMINGSRTTVEAPLKIWTWNGQNLTLEKSHKWSGSIGCVHAGDADGDGTIEIITAGSVRNSTGSYSSLRIWHWNGEEFLLKANEEWQLIENVYALTIAGGVQGNTMVNNVKVGDVDGDGIPEIITGGFTYDGEKVNAQLRIWMWDGETLSLEASKEWVTDYLNEVKCISLNDVDGDSRIEIVTSGIVAAYGSFANNATSPDRAQLRVWGWDGTTLTLKNSQDWTIGDGVCAWNVATSDVDGDGAVEIVTVGCMGIGTLCDPDMRIWSIVTPLPTGLIIVAVSSIIITVLATTYFFAKRYRK